MPPATPATIRRSVRRTSRRPALGPAPGPGGGPPAGAGGGGSVWVAVAPAPGGSGSVGAAAPGDGGRGSVGVDGGEVGAWSPGAAWGGRSDMLDSSEGLADLASAAWTGARPAASGDDPRRSPIRADVVQGPPPWPWSPAHATMA